MPNELQLIPGTLATACYPSDPQALYNEMFEKGNAQLGDLTGIIISDTAPDPEDRDKAWIKLTAAGGPPALSMPYVWYNGAWVARHLSPAGGNERRIWTGTTVELQSYDGGDTGAVSEASGPMWEVDTAFDFRFPLGAGTSPDSTVVAVNATGGAEDITLTEAQLPAHSHVLANSDTTGTTVLSAGQFVTQAGDVGSGNRQYALTGNSTTPSVGQTGDTGSDEAHSNMPPYIGVYFIKRTARVYYKA